MEEFFLEELRRFLGRDFRGEEEAFLVRDLMTRLGCELSIPTLWKFLEYLASHGMKREASDFTVQMADLIAKRILRLPGEWRKIQDAYASFLVKAQTKKWMKWSLKSSEQYYLFCSQLGEEFMASLPVIGVLGGEMSGDMFGIGAAMILKPNLSMLIKKTEGNPFDHTKQIQPFLESCVDDKSRVVVYTRSQTNMPWGSLLANEDTAVSELVSFMKPEKAILKAGAPDEVQMLPSLWAMMRAKGVVCWVCPLDIGTKFLKTRTLWEVDAPRQKLRRRWGVCEKFLETFHKLETWMASQGLPVQELRRAHDSGKSAEKKVLVIWSRFTGKKGEIHVEHDTSFKGTKELALTALELGRYDYVIITGDKPVVHDQIKLKSHGSLEEAQKARERKFATLCQEINSQCGSVRAFNLTAFWEDEDSKEWTLGMRTGQFRLFEYLHRVCDVRHLGMRSGNLEALALLGYWVRYMEETESWGGDRMAQWHERALGYQRIVLSAPPTGTGKYIIERVPKGTVFAPPKEITWISARQHLPHVSDGWWPEQKPDVIEQGGQITRKVKVENKTQVESATITPLAKGFAPADLDTILKELKIMNVRKRLDPIVPASQLS